MTHMPIKTLCGKIKCCLCQAHGQLTYSNKRVLNCLSKLHTNTRTMIGVFIIHVLLSDNYSVSFTGPMVFMAVKIQIG